MVERLIRYVVRIALDEHRRHAAQNNTIVDNTLVTFTGDAIVREIARHNRRRGA